MVGEGYEKRDIILHSVDGRLKRISEVHRSYDSLQYPLMFPSGDDGYSIAVPHRDPVSKAPLKKTVSAAEFYSYRLMLRRDDTSLIHLGRSLFSQYLVDEYACIESERLNFIRCNQKKLRAENYIHLLDSVSRHDAAPMSDVGQLVILPSSFTASPRWYHEKIQDAMTYVRHYGRPDLFITLTCNPRDPTIVNLLEEGQTAAARHDVVSRVFHLRVKLFNHLLRRGEIFGPVRAFTYTIETGFASHAFSAMARGRLTF